MEIDGKIYSFSRVVGVLPPEFAELKMLLGRGETPMLRLKFGPPVALEMRESKIYIKGTSAEVVETQKMLNRGARIDESTYHKLCNILGPPAYQSETTAYFQKGNAAYACELVSGIVTDIATGKLASLDTFSLLCAAFPSSGKSSVAAKA